MKECIGCHALTVDPADPARYDVLNPDPSPEGSGPYCAECFATTVTGQQIDSQNA